MAKILSFDIETAPLEGMMWGVWKQNIAMNQLKQDWSILTWAAKWLGEDQVMYDSVHYYTDDPRDDHMVLQGLWDLLDEADIVVAHNGNRFDIPRVNTRFLLQDMPPPSPYKKIDTCEVAKRNFAFTSNRLDNLGKFLGVGRKVDTGGFGLWTRCLAGDKEAFEKMLEYNVQDVQLLEDVYLAMRPYMPNHPNVGVHNDEEIFQCPKCGGVHLVRRGFQTTNVGKYQRYQCTDCGGWSRGRYTENSIAKRKALLAPQ